MHVKHDALHASHLPVALFANISAGHEGTQALLNMYNPSLQTIHWFAENPLQVLHVESQGSHVLIGTVFAKNPSGQLVQHFYSNLYAPSLQAKQLFSVFPLHIKHDVWQGSQLNVS